MAGHPNRHTPTQLKFGPSKKDQLAAQQAAAEANKVVPLPDPTDAAVRRRQMEELKAVMKRRGRSSTLLSGRTGDQSPTPMRKPMLARS